MEEQAHFAEMVRAELKLEKKIIVQDEVNAGTTTIEPSICEVIVLRIVHFIGIAEIEIQRKENTEGHDAKLLDEHPFAHIDVCLQQLVFRAVLGNEKILGVDRIQFIPAYKVIPVAQSLILVKGRPVTQDRDLSAQGTANAKPWGRPDILRNGWVDDQHIQVIPNANPQFFHKHLYGDPLQRIDLQVPFIIAELVGKGDKGLSLAVAQEKERV